MEMLIKVITKNRKVITIETDAQGMLMALFKAMNIHQMIITDVTGSEIKNVEMF